MRSERLFLCPLTLTVAGGEFSDCWRANSLCFALILFSRSFSLSISATSEDNVTSFKTLVRASRQDVELRGHSSAWPSTKVQCTFMSDVLKVTSSSILGIHEALSRAWVNKGISRLLTLRLLKSDV